MGIKDLLLEAPDTQLDPSMKPLIKKWNDCCPTALQVLEVLDQCINASLASGFVVEVLQRLYNEALRTEKSTHEEVVKLATWRKE